MLFFFIILSEKEKLFALKSRSTCKDSNDLDPFEHFPFGCSSALPMWRQRDSTYFILLIPFSPEVSPHKQSYAGAAVGWPLHLLVTILKL